MKKKIKSRNTKIRTVKYKIYKNKYFTTIKPVSKEDILLKTLKKLMCIYSRQSAKTDIERGIRWKKLLTNKKNRRNKHDKNLTNNVDTAVCKMVK
ncbi:MAG: hypothetical protein A2360_04345 [Candidatus Staskawiczbacteria bacterium RIFOXYB1_FULL_32_11]|nr:MAG: hypothetical protein A2360_04345 [Candidatus Staskawiczbacteria bacterium RIFOXYB1_FULL_32_11]